MAFTDLRGPSLQPRYFDISDYGAVSGAADVTARIQAAVNAAAMLGGTVYFPPGTWNYTSWTHKPTVNYLGNGPSTLLAPIAGTAAPMFDTNPAGGLSPYLIMENLTFSNAVNASCTGGVRICGADSAYLRNVRIAGHLGFGFRITGHTLGSGDTMWVKLDHCIAVSANDTTPYFTIDGSGGDGPSQVRLDHCRASSGVLNGTNLGFVIDGSATNNIDTCVLDCCTTQELINPWKLNVVNRCSIVRGRFEVTTTGQTITLQNIGNGIFNVFRDNEYAAPSATFVWTESGAANGTMRRNEWATTGLLADLDPYTSSGTASVTAGQTSVTVLHGLLGTPARVVITPTVDPGTRFWVSGKDASDFEINLAAAQAGAVTFDWRAELFDGS